LLPQQYSSGNDTTDADNHDHLRSSYLFMANERERDIGVTRYSYWNTLADEWIFFPTFYRRKLAVPKLNPFSIIIISVAYYAIETLCKVTMLPRTLQRECKRSICFDIMFNKIVLSSRHFN